MTEHDHERSRGGLMISPAEPRSLPSTKSKTDSHSLQSPSRRKPGSKAGMTPAQFWLAILGLNSGMLLTALDFNIVATAVPIISSEFHEYNDSQWLGTAFLITFALVQPICAKLGDMHGRKSLFLCSTLVFILGSALCGWSESMDMLIWCRALQGVGAGGIYGQTNVIITDLVELRDVGKYLSITAAVWGAADVAGPLLGGVFAQYATWRWCFWINLTIAPISFAIIFLVLRLPAPKMPVKNKFLVFDYFGAVVLAGGTTMVVLGLSWGGNTFPWESGRVIGCIVGGFILVALFVVIERFVKEPLVDLSMFKDRTLYALAGAQFFYGMVLLGSMYYLPQFFQLVFNDSATLSGVGLLPMMLGLMVGNPVAGFVTSKKGLSLINAIVGAGLQVLGMGLMTRWNSGTTRAEAVIVPFIMGIGQGAIMSGLLLSAQVSVKPAEIGLITGLNIFVQCVGDAFGITLFSAVYVNELAQRLGTLGLSQEDVKRVLSDVQGIRHRFSPDTVPRIVEAYAKSMQNGWWLLFAASGLCLICACLGKQHSFGQPDVSETTEATDNSGAREATRLSS